MIKGNPFLSETFMALWSKHFNKTKNSQSFEFISPLRFVKHRYLPTLYNTGGTLTKGIDYSLNTYLSGSLSNNVLIIYDVPTYFEVATSPQKNLGFYSSKQYPGYLIDLKAFSDFPQFMLSTFSKSSRYKLNKYKRRLEECFDIEYRMWFGDIPKTVYDDIFGQFRRLLEKRFTDKEIYNNNLDLEEWKFYYEVAYPLILQKKASLFVIYDSGTPIGITLNYFSDQVIFDAITVFDIDYSKFHLGFVTIMKLIEWSIENKFKVLDFSKGYFEYKTRWANRTYHFEYHIYFDATSFKSKLIANILKNSFDLKQYLRDKKLNEKLHKFTYRVKNNSLKKPSGPRYSFVEMDSEIETGSLQPIDLETHGNEFLKTAAFEFLYLNNECMKNLRIFKTDNEKTDYLLIGMVKKNGIHFEPATSTKN